MNDASANDTTQSVNHSPWRRFIDKLAGGPPNQEKLDKLKGHSWLVRSNVSLFMVVFWFLIGIVPEIVNISYSMLREGLASKISK